MALYGDDSRQTRPRRIETLYRVISKFWMIPLLIEKIVGIYGMLMNSVQAIQ